MLTFWWLSCWWFRPLLIKFMIPFVIHLCFSIFSKVFYYGVSRFLVQLFYRLMRGVWYSCSVLGNQWKKKHANKANIKHLLLNWKYFRTSGRYSTPFYFMFVENLSPNSWIWNMCWTKFNYRVAPAENSCIKRWVLPKIW